MVSLMQIERKMRHTAFVGTSKWQEHGTIKVVGQHVYSDKCAIKVEIKVIIYPLAILAISIIIKDDPTKCPGE